MVVTHPNDTAKPRVLVVDDDRASAKLLLIILLGEGYDVRAVASAEEALATLADFRPQAIVLDLVLPLMSGHLLAQRLKADPATRAIRIIAVTVFNEAAAERAAYDAGCDAYLAKPIDPAAFASLVKRHVGGSS